MEIVGLCLVITILSAIPAFVASWRRFMRHRSRFSSILLLVCALSTGVECFFLGLHGLFLSQPFIVDDMAGHKIIDFAINFACYGVVIFYNIVLLLVALYLKRGKMTHFFLAILGLFLVLLLAVAVVGSMITGRSLDECFFGACCGVLYVTGMALGFTYKEICVIINIYAQSGVCLLSALWVTWVAMQRFLSHKTTGNVVLVVTGIIYGLAYIGGFLWVCQHYAMPMNQAFDLCYQELLQLSKDYHTTYNNVNYIIFILLFLLITIGNMVIVKLLKNSVRRERLYNGSVTTEKL